jgi:hypothetical protein
VARALSARGHEVAFYTGAVVRDQIAREGWACFPFERVRDRLAAVVGAQGAEEDGDGLYLRVMQFQTRPFPRGMMRRGFGLRAVHRDTILGTVPESGRRSAPCCSCLAS